MAPHQKPPLQRTIYTGTFIDTPTPTALNINTTTAVGVDEYGLIAFIEHNVPYSNETSVYSIATKHRWPRSSYAIFVPPSTAEPENSTSGSKPNTTIKLSTFFFPGFLDTHTHAPQYPNTGIFGSSTLLSWLETYTFPMESSFADLSRAHRIYPRVVARSLANGTTAAAYYATTHVPATNYLADVCLEKGQRALVGRVCMDRMSPADYRDESIEEAVEKTRECMRHCASIDPDGEVVRPVITPRFAPSCTPQTLKALGELHKDSGCFVQTHVGENKAEIELVKELFPEAEDYVGLYKDAGLLTEKTVLAHAVYLTPNEIRAVKEAKAGVAHCPVSNSSLTSGCCRVRELLDQGVKVGLGTDMSGGYSPSILEVARQALLVSRYVSLEVEEKKGQGQGERHKLSVEEALYLGTVGGAEVMGLEKKVGRFEVGMEWDAQLICLAHVPESEASGDVQGRYGPVDLFGWEPWPEVVAKWVYTGDDRNVGAVWVKGRLVHARSAFDFCM